MSKTPEELEDLLWQCDRLRDMMRALKEAVEHADKRLQRIERQGRIWLVRAASESRDVEDDD